MRRRRRFGSREVAIHVTKKKKKKKVVKGRTEKQIEEETTGKGGMGG